MKTLYQIILTEARGLLRQEYSYEDIIDYITDIIVTRFDELSTSTPTIIVEDEILKPAYPSWVGKIKLISKNTRSNDVGTFIPSESKMVNGKLEFSIYINTLAIRKKSSDDYRSNVSRVVMKRIVESSLHHEFKHAFDDWVRKSKNILNDKEEKYFIDKEKLSYMNVESYWKTFFTSTHYLQSKFEKTAYQQELLNFYKRSPFGILFIKILKSKYGTSDKLIDYISNMHISEYTGFYFNIAEEMKEIGREVAGKPLARAGEDDLPAVIDRRAAGCDRVAGRRERWHRRKALVSEIVFFHTYSSAFLL
jgi:hypothetical protein